MTLDILDLGTKPYQEVWELQRRLVGERLEDRIPDTMILVEHEHVITLGRKTTPENFKPQGVPVFRVERGGDATYHGPGQLVGYPIVRLASPNVQAYVRTLEQALRLAVGRFGIQATTVEGHTGVWVGPKKLSSIGVAVTNWVTYHGFALNVSTDLSYFHLIRPCGLDPDTMTSMEQILGRVPPMDQVKRAVVEEFERAFPPPAASAASAAPRFI